MERLGLRRALEQLPRLFRHLYTVVLLWLTLVIFGAPGLSEGLAVLKGIFTWQSGAKGYTLAAFADTKLLLILAASFLLCGPVQALCPKLKAALYAKKGAVPCRDGGAARAAVSGTYARHGRHLQRVYLFSILREVRSHA